MGLFDGGGGSAIGGAIKAATNNSGSPTFGDAVNLTSQIVGIAGGAANSAVQIKLAKEEAKRARRFAKKGQTTAYQRTVRDLRLAGLNPILATRTGPTRLGGASGGAVLPSISGDAAATSAALASGQQTGRSKALQKAELNVLRAQEESALASASNQRNLSTEAAKRGEILSHQVHAARVRGDFDRSRYGTFLLSSQRGSELGSSALTNATNSAKNVINPFTHAPAPRLQY